MLQKTFPVQQQKCKPPWSHSGSNSVVASQGLDLVWPFSSQAEQGFSPCGWGYSSGKIPKGHNKIYLLNVFEWIQSLQRGCHGSLAGGGVVDRSVCQDILYCCLGIPPQPKEAGLWQCGNLGQMCDTLKISLRLKDYLCPVYESNRFLLTLLR